MNLFKKKNNNGVAQSKKTTKKKSGFSLGQKKKQVEQSAQAQPDILPQPDAFNQANPNGDLGDNAFQDTVNQGQKVHQQSQLNNFEQNYYNQTNQSPQHNHAGFDEFSNPNAELDFNAGNIDNIPNNFNQPANNSNVNNNNNNIMDTTGMPSLPDAQPMVNQPHQQHGIPSMGDDFQDGGVSQKKGFGFSRKSKSKINKTKAPKPAKSRKSNNKKSGGLFARKKKPVDTGFDEATTAFNQVGANNPNTSFNTVQGDNPPGFSSPSAFSESSASIGAVKSKQPNMKILRILAAALVLMILLALIAMFTMGYPFGSSGGTITGKANQAVEETSGNTNSSTNTNNSGTATSPGTVTVETDTQVKQNPQQIAEAEANSNPNNQADTDTTANAPSPSADATTENQATNQSAQPQTVEHPSQDVTANNQESSQPQGETTSETSTTEQTPQEPLPEVTTGEKADQQTAEQPAEQNASKPIAENSLTTANEKQMETVVPGNPSSESGRSISQQEFMNLTETKIYRDR